MDKKLFQAQDGKWVTDASLLKSLEAVRAFDCDILFIHSDLSFGVPNLECTRKELMGAVYDVVRQLDVKTICVPTFTFSFPNGKMYDVERSKSKMGAWNEYVRRLPGAIRSVDPLMSVALIGEKKYLVEDIRHESVGLGSTFDLLHKEKNVKFLFLGVRPAKCFTYTHYIEYNLGVPYRYNRKFTGRIKDRNGREYTDTYDLFVRYKDVEPTSRDDFERTLLSSGVMKKTICGDNALYCVDEKPAYDALCEKIQSDGCYMLEKPYPDKLVDEFKLTSEMIAL